MFTTVRHRSRSLVALALMALCAGGLGSAAHAGQGVSMWCNDGASLGGTYVQVIDDPVTLNAEVGASPAFVELCYSTTPRGNGAPAVTGGRVYATESGIVCTSDGSPVVLAVTCELPLDPDVTRPTRITSVTVRVQHLVVGAQAGHVHPAPLCLRNVVVYTGTSSIGPFGLGACP